MTGSVHRFQILGPLRVRRDETELPLGPRQGRVILALLLARAGQTVTTGEILTALWGARPPDSAVNILHRYIGSLRRVLEPDLARRSPGRWILPQLGGYHLPLDADCFDLLAFREIVRQAATVAPAEPEEGLRSYLMGLGLWRGRPAAGLTPPSAPLPALSAIEREYSGAVIEAAALALALQRPVSVLPALRQAATWDPANERLHASLLLVLSADGRQAEALSLYQEVRRRFGGAVPRLDEAYRRILHQLPESAPGPSPSLPPSSVTVSAPGPAVIRPAQLPTRLPRFVGRESELARLDEIFTERRRALLTVAVCGMPGVGKSTLAVHLAHRVAQHFPDGQLYADLRGFSAGPPVTPGAVLGSFLEALGVPRAAIPESADARAAMFRSSLAGRRMLVLLDDVRESDQASPLFPGDAGSAVVMTSRRRLTGLAANVGTRLFALDEPAPEEAVALLAARIGDRTAADPAVLAELAERAGRLPLALSILAARTLLEPGVTPASLLAELRRPGTGLDPFSSDELNEDLRTIFSWSYRTLSIEAATMFRALAGHPGPDITVRSAASLPSAPVGPARAPLEELAATGLLTARMHGRYVIHDLGRRYAAELPELFRTAHRI
ncbi:BTAD domain-containing putative transcriptional regulator [Actinoplanes sp. HUAS TT8]|uniref:AfsR/SARP family transcriptional regulator n=1 Tax=Actinoplanes sp. HUAS TT8 TaxID=3447453 RepID=UPI003F528BFA